MIHTQRPGFTLSNRAEHIKISINRVVPPTAFKLDAADIVVTVNELTSHGDLRLGVHTPALMSVCVAQSGNQDKVRLNRLRLSRGVGTSVVIRKKNCVSAQDAIYDLKMQGIYISNSTESLVKAGHKTGASLVFHANELIWKVVRLELTLLKGINL